MKVFIVIPAYNEDQKISEVINELKKKYGNIVIVDDGSTDNTYQLALACQVTVLSHLINRGQGAAIATGLKYALDQGAEIIVTFDADGQHQAEDIEKLIKALVENNYDVVLGSRFLNKNNQLPFFRKLLLKIAIKFTWLISGLKLTDTHNGLRAFTRQAAQKIDLKQDGMAHSSEIINEINKKKLKYFEVPVVVKYTEYSLKKGQQASDSFKILKDLFIKKITK